MLCSERELEVSEDHDGIIDLPQDAPLGARYIDYAGLNDPVFDIAITPNRPDALGVAGHRAGPRRPGPRAARRRRRSSRFQAPSPPPSRSR